MVPIKLKGLIPQLAKELEIPEEHLKVLIGYYYKENRKLLENLEYLHIKLRGLGVMTIKGWDIQKRIADLKYRVYASRSVNTRVEYQRELDNYTRILQEWEKQEEYKKSIKLSRKQYYDNKDINESKG